jgi:geranylgeranyl pyrophosphate synthase
MARPREQVAEEDVQAVRDLYERLGSVEFATGKAERLVEQAYETLEQIPVDDDEFFRQIVDYMASRTK